MGVEIKTEVLTMCSDIIPDAELDCVGLYCPMPIAMFFLIKGVTVVKAILNF